MLKKLLFGAGLAYLYRKFMGGSRRSSAYGQTGRRSGARW